MTKYFLLCIKLYIKQARSQSQSSFLGGGAGIFGRHGTNLREVVAPHPTTDATCFILSRPIWDSSYNTIVAETAAMQRKSS